MMRIMKYSILLLAMALILGINPTLALSQFSVQYEKVFKSRTLSGTIWVNSTEAVVATDVLVEDMTPNWKTMISSTRTDEKGHFTFPSMASKNLHYLRLSANGFRITSMKVKITRWARKKELSLFISVAT
jgi:hypothetical protein